jgi:hypothetical protein
MSNEHAVRSTRRHRQQAGQKSRGIASQDGMRRRHAIQLTKDLPLHVQVFEDRLDDKIGVGDSRAKIGAQRDVIRSCCGSR